MLTDISLPHNPDKSHTMGKVAIWLKSAGEQRVQFPHRGHLPQPAKRSGSASERRWMPLKPKYQEQQGYNTGMRVGATPTVATKKVLTNKK